jgi:tRNA (uracil-5-)-methyltransferase
VDAVAAVAEEYFAIGLHGHDYKWWGSERCMKEFTEKLKLNISHVDKAKGKMVAFLEFNSKADRDTAITALEGVLDKKGKPAYRIKTDVKGKPQGQRGANSSKRKAEKNADGIDDRDRPSKKQKDNSNNHVGIFDRIRNEVPEGERVIQDAVTPLWRLPYEEQLRLKGKDMENILRKWAKEVKKVDKSVQTFGPHGGTLCPLEPIVPSPVTEGYRNKCTFAIGVNQQGLATAGFTLSSFDASVSAGTYIESPADCKNTPTSAVACADLMSAYARSTTGTFSTYDKASHTGLWRMLQVRSNEKGGELMVTVQINPTDVSNEQIVEITKGLIETFKPAMTDEWKGKCGGQKIVSLQIQRWDGSSNAAPDDVPTEVIWGCEFITQRLLGFEFRMSSNSFFQVRVVFN